MHAAVTNQEFKAYTQTTHTLKVQNSDLKHLVAWKSILFCKKQKLAYLKFYGMQDRLRGIYNFIMLHLGSTGWREVETEQGKQLQWKFDQAMTTVQAQLQAFETWVHENNTLNDFKRDMQFYATPLSIGRELLEWANLDWSKYKKTAWLEPSAGHGNLIDAVREKLPNAPIHACELDPTHRLLLKDKYPKIQIVGENFLQAQLEPYNLIVANPPFSTYSYERGDDIRHIHQMFDNLKNGGVCLAIISTTWHRNQQIDHCRKFKTFLDANSEYKIFEKGKFADSGTMSSVAFVKLQK